MAEIRRGFELNGDGLRAAAARARLVDELVLRFWAVETAQDPSLLKSVAVTSVGGYGRGLLFPYSDVDLLVCVEKSRAAAAKQPVRRLSQQLWDCGLQVSIGTRTPSECERFEATNPEFGISLLDLRFVGGSAELFAKLRDKSVARLRQRDMKGLCNELARLTRDRHFKYGHTLFHLEPNVKECPGGLRDANVCEWLRSLRRGDPLPPKGEFQEAIAFLAAVRCFLHYRHSRDDNTLDWLAQDAAAESAIGQGRRAQAPANGIHKADPASWMRSYFRYARVVERCLLREADELGLRVDDARPSRRVKLAANKGFRYEAGRIDLSAALPDGTDSAHDPDTVLAAFGAVALTGARFTPASEERIADAIPVLSASLEEGPGLWQRLSSILTSEHAAMALRTMHALGVLELILPEFHGIDALVIRDAYHRYTVDEHTFVLIEMLHGLAAAPAPDAPAWRTKFASMLRELQNPALLYLAGVLHDTGKGRAGGHHAVESCRLAKGVLARLEIDAYDASLVLHLIENHLEMSAALRRDIFDTETVRAFAAKVQTHESLRMLTLFTYADIAAVHPDALTPWKAENLWRLSMAAANYLDRNVDEDRVHTRTGGGLKDAAASDGESSTLATGGRDKIERVLSLSRGMEPAVEDFLNGFPERYLSTRSPETIAGHFAMTRRFEEEPFQIQFQPGVVNEITLVTHDRPRLFAGMSAALAAWGMNVLTADAFANAKGVVVDTFRFTDTFRTLELNPSERERFVSSVREMVAGEASTEKLLNGQRRARRKAPRVVIDTKIDFDGGASSQSTLLQVIAQDTPGLLRAVSATLSKLGYSVEVALIDTEGDSAIDVFYITKGGMKLDAESQTVLSVALRAAIGENAQSPP
jgi:[protein-PII] uridylyltransferase